MKVKFTAFLLLCIMISIVAASCSNNTSEPEEEPDTSVTEPSKEVAEEPENEEPIHIVWLSEDPPAEDDTGVQQYLEEKFNVTIENVKFDNTNYVEQLNIRVANKEIPDLMFGRFDYEAYASQGILAELPVEEIKENMPVYSASVEEMDAKLWGSYMVNGKNYMIPRYSLDGSKPLIPQIRLDWLKKVGISKPPETIAELEYMCDKFTNDDPDGNGQKDTFCATSVSTSFWLYFQVFFGAYDVHITQWKLNDNGELVYGLVTDNAREALKTLRDFYAKGYIEKEFITNTAEQWTTKFNTGAFGITHGNFYFALSPDAINKSPVVDLNPNAEFVAGKVIHADGYQGLGYAFGTKTNGIAMGVQVESDPAKKAKIYEILEALATDKETYLRTFYGEEGVHYDMADGVAIPKSEYAVLSTRGNKVGAGEYYNPFGRTSQPMSIYFRTKVALDFYESHVKGQNAVYSDVNFTIPGRSDYPDLSKLEEQYIVKFMTGEVNLDKGFDDFVQLWKNSGGQAVTDSANAEYKRRYGN